MVTCIRIDRDLAVHHLRHFDRAVHFDLADFTAAAFLRIDLRYSLADDSEVVQIRFHTVIRASAHRNLKLMRKFDTAVAVDQLGMRRELRLCIWTPGTGICRNFFRYEPTMETRE